MTSNFCAKERFSYDISSIKITTHVEDVKLGFQLFKPKYCNLIN